MAVSSPDSPHPLAVVIDFVNTLDLDAGTDGLATPGDLDVWLRGRGLSPGGAAPTGARQHAEAIELREALRAAMLAHNGAPADERAAAVLERAAERGALSVLFRDDGSVGVGPRASGFPAILARLLVPVAEAAADGTWERAKACRADDCRWAFYDESRNRSARWCDMAVCGNRTKVRAYRAKRGVTG
jgi:predicted RNA-binding Zn ribbon-like protein